MHINGTFELYAADAVARTEKAKQPVGAWVKLFDRIAQQADLGNSRVVFNEETEGVRFTEERKAVKERLELLGYTVEYHRESDADSAYYGGGCYHNVYIINW